MSAADDALERMTGQPAGRFRLARGDAMRLLCDLPDGIADAVVTDPPYSSGGAFRADRNVAAGDKYLRSDAASRTRIPEFHGDSRTERGLLLWSTLWLAECWRVTRTGGAIAVFCDWRSLPTFSDALQAGGWSWRGTGVWIKPPSRSRPVKGGLWNDTEYVLWGSKGPRTEGECLPGTWQTAAPGSATRLHVTEKPQQILADLVRLAPPAGLVLDPFTGSASTGIAALGAGRRFIGFELSTEYAEIATTRLEQYVDVGADVHTVNDQPGLFSSDPLDEGTPA